MEEEVWKDIANYEGFYQVSSTGRLKSLIRRSVRKERFLLPTITVNGYQIIGLSKNGKRWIIAVHALVANAFIEKPIDYGEKIVIDHINGNTLDNRADNLRFVSQRFNLTDGYRKNRDKLTSKYSGVSYNKKEKKWVASIHYKKRTKRIGSFMSEIDAANAYQNELSNLKQQYHVD